MYKQNANQCLKLDIKNILINGSLSLEISGSKKSTTEKNT